MPGYTQSADGWLQIWQSSIEIESVQGRKVIYHPAGMQTFMQTSVNTIRESH